jgi:hypothetical protein
MSVLSPKRAILFVAATLLGSALYASHPSPRAYPAMAYNELAGAGVLFGGRGLEDPATALIHASNETWLWINNQWVQQHPAVAPPGRSAHGMTYDARRGRIILFGGRRESTDVLGTWDFYGDMWKWQDGDWEQIQTATAPPAREYPGLAYDRERDKVILFGGYNVKADGRTSQALFDTWEFDGVDWRQVSATGPEVAKPLLAYDAARKQTVMLGVGAENVTQMFVWNPATSAWDRVTATAPATLPTCVNEGGLVYDPHRERLIAVGGVCTLATSEIDEAWEWDGEKWTKIETNPTTRFMAAAVAFDAVSRKLVRFGGFPAFSQTPDSSTYVLSDRTWRFTAPVMNPIPRSLHVFKRDPVRNHVLLLGGLSEFATPGNVFYIDDFWRFERGEWYRELRRTGMPGQCLTPLAAWDTDRSVMVVVCGDGRVAEWDGNAWKVFSDLEDEPNARRFAGLVYDETLKKTVYFGGWDSIGFRDDTWTWDGTVWKEVNTKDEPENRAQMAMWYDPLAKKTILFSGAGRPNIDSRVTRFNDMWSFDGNTWTKMNVTETPGIRMAAQVAVDPRDGTILLFGGLRATVNGKIVEQFYGNDLWRWNGATGRWTAVPAEGVLPPPRNNTGFEWDPSLEKFVLFGGFAGNFYYSDVWTWDGTTWTVIADRATQPRRRSSRQ